MFGWYYDASVHFIFSQPLPFLSHEFRWRWAALARGDILTVAGSPPCTGNGSASSPPPALNDNRPAGDNLDTILFQLRQVTRERGELRKRLALASPGTTFDDCRYRHPPPTTWLRRRKSRVDSLYSVNLCINPTIGQIQHLYISRVDHLYWMSLCNK